MIQMIFWFAVIFLLHEFGHWIIAKWLCLEPKIIWYWWGAEVLFTKKQYYLTFEEWWFISSAGLLISMPLTIYLMVAYPDQLIGSYAPLFWFGISIGDLGFQIISLIAKIQNPFFYFTEKTQYNFKLEIKQHGDD